MLCGRVIGKPPLVNCTAGAVDGMIALGFGVVLADGGEMQAGGMPLFKIF